MGCGSSKDGEGPSGHHSDGSASPDKRPVQKNILADREPKTKFEDYKVEKKLGEGAFGIVYQVTVKETGEVMALKVLPKAKILTPRDREGVRYEVKIMEHLNGSSSIVNLYDAFEDAKNVYIALELCVGGDMFARLLSKGHYSEKDAAALCRAMLQMVAHCHANGVAHRDIKPENFLFDGTGDDAKLKATDFGLATFFTNNHRITRSCGTPIYIAPEVINKAYDEKCDVWSTGVVLYILLSGKVPFYGKTVDAILEKTLAGKIKMQSGAWETISEPAQECVRLMLTYDADKRPSAAEMLKHPWLKKDGVASSQAIAATVFDNLKEFSAMNKLKKVALNIMANNMQEEDLETIHKAFERADSDRSGTLTVAEVREAFKRTNMDVSDAQMKELWSAYDVDENGEIDYSEFLAAAVDLKKIKTVENLQYAFSALDKDGNGNLTAEEVLEALGKLNVDEAEARRMIAEADANKDGVIDYNEFVMMFSEDNNVKGRGELGLASFM